MDGTALAGVFPKSTKANILECTRMTSFLVGFDEGTSSKLNNTADTMHDEENKDTKNEQNITLDAALAMDVCDVGYPWMDDEFSFLKLQEASNMSKAAYMEIMTMAMEAQTWINAQPALGSIDDLLKLFLCESPAGKRVECSIESAVVPIPPIILVSTLLQVETWSSIFCHIVHRGSSSLPTGVMGKLNNDDHAMQNLEVVNAEFHLPTPFVQNRKSCFLRWQKEVIPNVWAILDLSCDYFPYCPFDCTLEPNCWKKPSGVIIRPHGSHSEVIWIENIEVNEGQVQDNIFCAVMNSDLAFSAKRWVRTLLWQLKRHEIGIYNTRIEVGALVYSGLLELTSEMKKVYLGCVNSDPDCRKWVILNDQGVRILRAVDHGGMSNNYIAVTSFRVQADLPTVFDFLVEKNVDIQWRTLLHNEGHEEIVGLSDFEETNCITLHRKMTEFMDLRKQTEYGDMEDVSDKEDAAMEMEDVTDTEYLLQEASRDEFCSFIVSAPMTLLEGRSLIEGRPRNISLLPSGFAVMCDGSMNSDASLVTIALQEQVDDMETEQIIEMMSDLVNTIIADINEWVIPAGSNQGSQG
ncbi:hypothetical protein NMG60_11034642 [Bertholletia excelsa]